MWSQILLPIILAALVFLAVTYLIVRSAFQAGGDVGRWAAISTIWLILPVMLGGLIVLAILGALRFMLARVPGFIAPYSYRIQRIFYRVEYGTKRLAVMAQRPVLMMQGLASVVKSGISRAREGIW
jgi:hypothetical protein